ncbi:MAG: endonuclease/exonuclease/phosphatase family protein, partial [Deltaproteobacteria bacterium]|nr:endonuclease/exonuclease/phosphatase family protein [Deltaproteobacteria bacterium]
FLADEAQFPHWYDKTNRNWGRVARHSMGVLSRYASIGISRHDLPCRVPGRGALMVRFGNDSDPLVIILAHLSLGKKARKKQIRFMGDLVNRYNHVILMGDLNCGADSEEFRTLIASTDLSLPYADLLTYPSWKPTKHIDHILVSKSIQINNMQVLDYPLSDHLPLSMEVSLPREIFMPTHSEYKAA